MKGLKISDSELEVMKVLWKEGRPMSYPDIYGALPPHKKWAKNTVKTLIVRLVDKGVLQREPGEVFLYSPTVSREIYMKEKTHSFLEQVYDGSAKGLVSALLQGEFISEEEREELEEFWRKGREKHG